MEADARRAERELAAQGVGAGGEGEEVNSLLPAGVRGGGKGGVPEGEIG